VKSVHLKRGKMIKPRRKLWLMISCNVYFSSQERHKEYYENFINRLKLEEVNFCLDYLQKNGGTK